MLLNPLLCAALPLSVLHLTPRENEVFYDVVAIVDPLTREAQKMSSLLIVSCIFLSNQCYCEKGYSNKSCEKQKFQPFFPPLIMLRLDVS